MQGMTVVGSITQLVSCCALAARNANARGCDDLKR